MATETTNYKLKKPAQNDLYNVDDFNGNMDKVDMELAKRVEKVMGTTGNLLALDDNGKIKDSGKTTANFLSSATLATDIGGEAAGAAAAVNTSLVKHTGNTTAHLTESEKAKLTKVFTTDDIVVSSTQPVAVKGRIWIKI